MSPLLNVSALVLGLLLLAPERWRTSSAARWALRLLAALVVVLSLMNFPTGMEP